MTFTDLKIDSRLVEALTEVEITTPTPIQQEAIPPAVTKQDVLGIAPTGSGKTLAYLLPALTTVLNAKVDHNNPTILILVPTRELVKQVDLVIKDLSAFTEIKTARIFAGPRENKHKRAFQDDFVDVVIATPGRLKNFLEDGIVDLKDLSILIIDEVDRLLDMGFIDIINDILAYLPHKNARQTLLFGSTMPPQVEALALALQKRRKLVDVGRSQTPDSITHEVFEVEDDDKFDVLVQILKEEDIDKVIIFNSSQHEARITARLLRREGLELEEIHAGLTQRQRTQALENFRSGIVNALVASDVAARGLDIPDVTHIISYDVPSDFNDYIHRAGRTGRAFRSGYSWILASPKEFSNLANIDSRLPSKPNRKRKLEKKKRRRVASSQNYQKYLKNKK